MEKEELNLNPNYEVDEGEEEVVTLDFENKTIYQAEDHVISKEEWDQRMLDAYRNVGTILSANREITTGNMPTGAINTTMISDTSTIKVTDNNAGSEVTDGATIKSGKITAQKIAGGKITVTGQLSYVEVQDPNTFKNELQDLLLNTITSKAVASLLAKHRALDTELDLLLENKRMGELRDLLDNEIDSVMEKRRRELKACYIGDKVRYESIPEWARTYVKEYMRDMIGGIALLLDDGEK